MLDGTDVLWPAVEDYYYLMKMRVSDGPAFFVQQVERDVPVRRGDEVCGPVRLDRHRADQPTDVHGAAADDRPVPEQGHAVDGPHTGDLFDKL